MQNAWLHFERFILVIQPIFHKKNKVIIITSLKSIIIKGFEKTINDQTCSSWIWLLGILTILFNQETYCWIPHSPSTIEDYSIHMFFNAIVNWETYKFLFDLQSIDSIKKCISLLLLMNYHNINKAQEP